MNNPYEIKEANAPEEAVWQISKRTTRRAIGIAVIIIYWLIYLWQDALANYGNYRYFSYSFHEAYAIGYFLVPLITAIWFAKVFVGTIKKKNWRKNAVLLLALALLLLLQVRYIDLQSQVLHTTGWTEVVDIPNEYHIVIQGGNGENITLETTPAITRLLKTDGTIYGIAYERKEHSPKGVLNGIWASQDEA